MGYNVIDFENIRFDIERKILSILETFQCLRIREHDVAGFAYKISIRVANNFMICHMIGLYRNTHLATSEVPGTGSGVARYGSIGSSRERS